MKLHKPCQEQIFFHHSMKFGSCIPHNFFRMFRKLFKTSPHRYLLPGKIELAGAVLKTESNSPKSFIIIRVVTPTITRYLPPTNHTAENNFLDFSRNCSLTWRSRTPARRNNPRDKTIANLVMWIFQCCSTPATKAIVID